MPPRNDGQCRQDLAGTTENPVSEICSNWHRIKILGLTECDDGDIAVLVSWDPTWTPITCLNEKGLREARSIIERKYGSVSSDRAVLQVIAKRHYYGFDGKLVLGCGVCSEWRIDSITDVIETEDGEFSVHIVWYKTIEPLARLNAEAIQDMSWLGHEIYGEERWNRSALS